VTVHKEGGLERGIERTERDRREEKEGSERKTKRKQYLE
jgi:hypothetical protein